MRARQLALEAKPIGDTGNLLKMLLDLPEDGSEPSFSGRKPVDDVMKAGEADFSRGDLDQARAGYLHALLLEPRNYEAILSWAMPTSNNISKSARVSGSLAR